eukprot:SAG22_NODE_201_length_15391_cov_7.662176_11_plen_256_part_00
MAAVAAAAAATSADSACRRCGQSLVWCTCLPEPDPKPEPEPESESEEEEEEEEEQGEGENGSADGAERGDPAPAKLRKPKKEQVCGSCGQQFVWCACSPVTGLREARRAGASGNLAGSGDRTGGLPQPAMAIAAAMSAAATVARVAEPTPEVGPKPEPGPGPEPDSPQHQPLADLPPSPKAAATATLYWGQRHQDKDFGVPDWPSLGDEFDEFPRDPTPRAQAANELAPPAFLRHSQTQRSSDGDEDERDSDGGL